MQQTRLNFTHDKLIETVRTAITKKLKILNKDLKPKKLREIIDAVMSALAMFTFKHQSLLQFDEIRKEENNTVCQNLQQLFHIHKVPCDTTMRERLDEQGPEIIRVAFKAILSLLQRGNLLKEFLFLGRYYLIPLDGTGFFSSSTIHCEQCCTKNHKDGSVTYQHQMVTGAIVHPNQKVVIPLPPEPIMRSDGEAKNDCERNASKRWVEQFRLEHPHLPTVILADGLHSNAPFIKMLKEHRCHFILVCQEKDHKYLIKQLKHADMKSAPIIINEHSEWHQIKKYQYMNNVPINESNKDCLVNILKYTEYDTLTGEESKWLWVTDLDITKNLIGEMQRGGRSRWSIENEVFNTLKNQGYHFEHNYGHGYKNLSTMFGFIMLLAFLIDQCLQKVNKLFQQAYLVCGAKYVFWERMRGALIHYIVHTFEKMYAAICRPPPQIDLDGVML